MRMIASMFLRLTILASAVSSTVIAAESPLTAALKSGEKRQYEIAILKIRQAMPQLSEQERVNANYITAVMSLKSAELYQSFNRINLAAFDEAYNLLAKEKKEFRSQYIDFYTAEHLVESGKCDAAAPLLKRVLDNKSILATFKDYSRVLQAACIFRNGGAKNGAEMLAKIKPSNVVVAVEKLAVAAAASKKDVLAEWKKINASANGDAKKIRFVSKSLAILTAAGEFDAALDLVASADLSSPDFEEASKDKTYFYYDVSLLRNLADFYLANARHYFNKLVDHPKLGDQVKFYLMQASLLDRGDLNKRIESVAFPNDATAPEKLKPLLSIYRNALQDYRTKKLVDGVKLVSGNEQQLDLLAEAVRVCRLMAQKCESLIALSKKNGGEAFGARFVNINRALGEYYLANGDVSTAQTYLEYARDKSNKNKIEANEPVLLTALADVYFHSKTYSESLEILFEFAKYFPAVRQLQEAMQSIYSVDHKSAGDVRIF